MPSARRQAFFASFLLPLGQKGWRLTVRELSVFLILIQALVLEILPEVSQIRPVQGGA